MWNGVSKNILEGKLKGRERTRVGLKERSSLQSHGNTYEDAKMGTGHEKGFRGLRMVSGVAENAEMVYGRSWSAEKGEGDVGELGRDGGFP